MKGIEKRADSQGGQALLTAIIFLLALTFLGFALVTMSSIDIHSSRNMRLAQEAFFAAEEGAMFGTAYAADLSNPGMAERVLSGNTAPLVLDSIADAGKGSYDRYHYTVSVQIMGDVDCAMGLRPAELGAQGASCKAVWARSTGMVNLGQLTDFDEPQFRKRVEMIANVVVF